METYAMYIMYGLAALYILFGIVWAATRKSMKTIDNFSGEYDFLSNFYLCKVYYNGKEYPSVEHAFQAAKTNDSLEEISIRCASTPGMAKRMGRKVINFRADWETVKTDIMTQVVKAKFSWNADLAKKLRDTGDALLVEGNTWNDRCWGVCDGVGENRLGIILMKVRDELKGK